MTKSDERQEEELKNLTKQLKHKEDELEKFMVYINVLVYNLHKYVFIICLFIHLLVSNFL